MQAKEINIIKSVPVHMSNSTYTVQVMNVYCVCPVLIQQKKPVLKDHPN